METYNHTVPSDYLETGEAQQQCASTSLETNTSETYIQCEPNITEKINQENSPPLRVTPLK